MGTEKEMKVLEHKIQVFNSILLLRCLLTVTSSLPFTWCLCHVLSAASAPSALCSQYSLHSLQPVLPPLRLLLGQPTPTSWLLLIQKTTLLEIIILAAVSLFYLVCFFFKSKWFSLFSLSMFLFHSSLIASLTCPRPCGFLQTGRLSLETTCGVICPAITCCAACSCLFPLNAYCFLTSDQF